MLMTLRTSITTAQIGPDDKSLLREFLFHALFIPDGEQPLDRNVLELLIRHQIRGLSLSVDKRNPAARFYLRAGYKVIREAETALVMIRHLPETCRFDID